MAFVGVPAGGDGVVFSEGVDVTVGPSELVPTVTTGVVLLPPSDEVGMVFGGSAVVFSDRDVVGDVGGSAGWLGVVATVPAGELEPVTFVGATVVLSDGVEVGNTGVPVGSAECTVVGLTVAGPDGVDDAAVI